VGTPTPPSTGSSAPPSSSVEASAEPAPASRPSSRAFVATMTVGDLGMLLAHSPLAHAFFIEAVEDASDRGVEAQASPSPAEDWPAKLGVAASTRVVVEGSELDARAAAAAGRWRLYDPSLPRDVVGASLAEEPAAKKQGFVMSRVTVASAETKLPELVAGAFRAESAPTPVEGGRMFTRRAGDAVVVRTVGGATEVARVVGTSPITPSDAKRVLQALDAWERPPAESGALRVELRPPAMSLASFWLVTSRGVGPATVDPFSAARALEEGKVALMVDAPEYEPRYAKVVVEVGPTVVATADLAGSTPPPDPRLWSTDGADVEIDGARGKLSVNGELLFDWPLLPKSVRGNPYRAHEIDRMVTRPTSRALLLGGELPFYLARLTVEQMEQVGQPTRRFMRRFERVGCVSLVDRGGALACFGLVDASATEEQIGCALEPEDRGCATAARLVRDKPVGRAGFWIMRRKVGDRTVLLAARSVDDVKALKPKVVKGKRAAFVADVPPESLGSIPSLADSAFHLEGKLAGSSLVFEARPIAMPSASSAAALTLQTRADPFGSARSTVIRLPRKGTGKPPKPADPPGSVFDQRH
jgi:hypothetical protein